MKTELETLRKKLLSTSAEAVMRGLPQKIVDLLDDATDEIDQILGAA